MSYQCWCSTSSFIKLQAMRTNGGIRQNRATSSFLLKSLLELRTTLHFLTIFGLVDWFLSSFWPLSTLYFVFRSILQTRLKMNFIADREHTRLLFVKMVIEWIGKIPTTTTTYRLLEPQSTIACSRSIRYSLRSI